MKIIFPFKGDKIGGSYWSSIQLIQNLQTRNIETIVVIHQSNEILEKILLERKIKYKIIKLRYIFEIHKIKYFFLFLFLEMAWLVYFVIKNKIDIVHTNDNGIHIGWTIVAKFSNKKHIFHLRNSKLPPFKIWNYLKKFPSIYIYLSEFNGKDLNGINAKKFIVPNPIEVLKENLKKDLNEIVQIGFVGNIEPRKRFDLFLKICKELNNQNKFQFQFNIFGQTNNLDFKSIADEVPNLRFFGFVADIDFVFSKIDILICPAENEPLGRALLEAMLKRIPVIASNLGGHSEILNNKRGFLISKSDPSLYCSCINKVILNWDNLDSMLDNAYRFVKESYSSERSTDKIIEIYKELINKN